MDENKLLNFFKKNFNFFSGVPDSLLSSFTKKLKGKKIVHLIASNEGAAISHGIGYFLAKKKVPCIYFQNSGLGNSINPIISIAHKTVYSLPLFIVIGWRGAPGSNDEPQHMAKGNITPHMLKLLGIKTFILKKNNHIYNLKKLKNLLTFSKKNNVPVACLIKKSVIINKSKSELKRLPKKFLRNSLIESVLKKIKKMEKIFTWLVVWVIH
jgi:phosphonopyruvate decarboxylase